MRKPPGYCAGLLGAMLMVACGSPPDLERRVAALEAANADLASKLSKLETRVESQATEEAILDPTKKGYALARSNHGRFLMAIDDVAAYADGQKLMLRIGNPYTMTFNGFTLTVSYGPREPEEPSSSDAEALKKYALAYGKWYKALGQKELSFPDGLQPGRWNKVTIIVAPAKVEEVGYVAVKISNRSGFVIPSMRGHLIQR